jgi:lipopolysaccharide export LptBFGC system permease protein LptF
MTNIQVAYFKAREEQRNNLANEALGAEANRIAARNADANAVNAAANAQNAATNARNASTREAELEQTRIYQAGQLENTAIRNSNDYNVAFKNADTQQQKAAAEVYETQRHNMAMERQKEREVNQGMVKVVGTFIPTLVNGLTALAGLT